MMKKKEREREHCKLAYDMMNLPISPCRNSQEEWKAGWRF